MASGELTVGGFDLDGINFEILDLPNWRTFGSRRFADAQSALRDPRFLLSSNPSYARRPLTVVGKITGTSDANLQSNIDTLLSECDSKSELTLEFAFPANRVLFCYLEDVVQGETTRREFGQSNPWMRLTMQFMCIDPFWYADATASQSAITGATAIPTGTAPGLRDFVLTVNGGSGASDPVIVYRNSSSTTIKLLALTGAVGAGETRVIDMAAGTIDSGGVNKISERNVGTDFPFVLDSRDGIFRTSSWPTLEISATGGTMTLDVQKRLAYL